MRVVKLAYCYEQWDVFDTLIDNAIAAIQVRNREEIMWLKNHSET